MPPLVPSVVDDVGAFIISGSLKNAGSEDFKIVKDPEGILSTEFAADALDFESVGGRKPKFRGGIAKWSLETFLKARGTGDPKGNGVRSDDSGDNNITNNSQNSDIESNSDEEATGKRPSGPTYDLAAGQSMDIKYNGTP